MYIVLSIIFVIIGVIMIIKPEVVFDVTESWKSYSSSEPSKLYLFSTRFGGAMFLLVGIGGLITFLLI